MAGTISLREALDRVLAAVVGQAEVEDVPLSASRGRTLAREVRSDGPWPTTDRSAMDGFGVYAGPGGWKAPQRLPVVGESRAGHPFHGAVEPGQAIRIMTGAVVPAGIDAVVPVEQTSGFSGAEVEIGADVRPGQNIRRAGSEVAPGQVLLRAGTRIRAAEVGALAVLGITRVAVFRPPVVAVLATGDEVVPVENEPAPHQVRDSNSWALCAQIEERGGEPLRLGITGDDAAELRARLERGLATADVLLTIGGVSKGTHDLVHGLLRELGVQERFHGVALKPGKPTYFGVRRDAERTTWVFGLPGNPASCFTVFDLLVAPLLAARLGAPAPPAAPGRARPGGAGFKPNRRLQAIPSRLGADGDGQLWAELLPFQPSGDPFGLLGADAFALVPEDSPTDLRAVEVRPYGALPWQP